MGKLEWLRVIWDASVEKLCLIISLLLLLLSFNPVSYTNRELSFQFTHTPNWYLLVTAVIVFGVFVYKTFNLRVPSLSFVRRIDKGHRIRLSPRLTIDVITGEIQDTSINKSHGAVVLPANTSFDDDCIRDTRSALGAFFQTHFPNGIDEIQGLIKSEVAKVVGHSCDELRECSPGTTVFLDQPLGSDYRILVTAVTRFTPNEGIRADTLSLIASLKAVFRASAGQRLSELCMPVLGTGHGGLDFSAALSLMLVQCVHCVMHEAGHHIKRITIVVHDPDNSREKEMNNVIQSISGILRG